MIESPTPHPVPSLDLKKVTFSSRLGSLSPQPIQRNADPCCTTCSSSGGADTVADGRGRTANPPIDLPAISDTRRRLPHSHPPAPRVH